MKLDQRRQGGKTHVQAYVIKKLEEIKKEEDAAKH